MAISSVKTPSPNVDLSITSEDSTPYLSKWRLAIVTGSLCLGTLLVAIDTTMISVAIPKISTDFKALDDIGWYGSAYLLTVTAFQPAFGSVYKFFDAKWVYLVSIFTFEVGSIICAAGPNSAVFIVGRAISGIGAAGLYQGALSIVGLTVKLEDRPLFLGIVLSAFGIAVCLGPPLGGVLTDHASWRWCFWINLPIGAVSFLLILPFLKIATKAPQQKASIQKRLRSLDVGNTAYYSGWTSLPWKSSRVVGLFVGFGLLTITFGLVQWKKGDKATIPLRILRKRSVFMGAWYLFFLEMSIYDLYYLPFYFQSAQGVSATISGVRAIPLGLSQIFAVIIIATIVTKTGYYVPFMVAGQLVAIVGTVLLSRLTVETPTAIWATYLVVTGIGFGMGLQMPFTALQVVLSGNDISTGNAISVFFSQLGAAIAIAIGQSIFISGLADEISSRTKAISPGVVLGVGPTALRLLAETPAVLRALQDAYASAISRTMYFSLATACVALPFACGMQWLNVQKVAKQKAEPSVVNASAGSDT
ncbi:efflux pump antibiotic resistance protein [Halenospora varia]|nr:efflux pump antibiotic resistance protein [Halenospora varia]